MSHWSLDSGVSTGKYWGWSAHVRATPTGAVPAQHGTGHQHFLTSKQDSWPAERGSLVLGIPDPSMLRLCWRLDIPFRTREEQSAWHRMGGICGFPRVAGGPAGVPVLLLAATGRSRALPVSWALWPGMGSPSPNPSHFQTALSAASVLDKLLFAPTVPHGASEVPTYLQDIWELLQAGLCGEEVVWASSATPENEWPWALRALSSGCISYWISTKKI